MIRRDFVIPPPPMRSHFLSASFLRLMSLVFVGLVAGCSIPIPQAAADPTRYYVLSSAPVSAAAGGAPAANASVVHLRPVELASYLRTRPLIVRRGDNEIQFREFARWGESLDLGIARVLREELQARGAAASIGAGARSTAARELTVRVLAFEGTADGGVNVRVTWEIAGPASGSAVEARGDFRGTTGQWDGRSEGSLAARLSESVGALAGEIAAALKK